MKRATVLCGVWCLMLVGCGRQADLGTQQPAAPPPEAALAAAGAEVGEWIIGEPVRHKNLTIFPVLSKQPRDDDRYLTLDEGLKAGTIEIREVGAGATPANPPANGQGAAPNMGLPDLPQETPAVPAEPTMPSVAPAQPPVLPEPADVDPFAEPSPPPKPGILAAVARALLKGIGVDADALSGPVFLAPGFDLPFSQTAGSEPMQFAGDVNRLVVVNRSGRPLYLMPGEVIYGGQQDRAVADESIIMADSKPTTINVYCVEHGRWGTRAPQQTIAALAAADIAFADVPAEQLAQQANQGKFVAGVGNLGKRGRMVVQDRKEQTEVWGIVGTLNNAAGVQTESDTYTANYTSAPKAEELKQYIDRLMEPIASRPQVVGAIVAINGKVESVDIFGSTPLFKKLWPKLLKGHALDAANAARAADAEKTCAVDDARAFLTEATQAAVERKELQGGLVVTKRDAERVMSFSASIQEKAEGEASSFGGMGLPAHFSAFGK